MVLTATLYRKEKRSEGFKLEDAEPYALFQHDGVEFIYMLTGKVIYRHADKLYPRSAGDALFFDAGAPHGPEELLERPMTCLSIIIYPRS